MHWITQLAFLALFGEFRFFSPSPYFPMPATREGKPWQKSSKFWVRNQLKRVDNVPFEGISRLKSTSPDEPCQSINYERELSFFSELHPSQKESAAIFLLVMDTTAELSRKNKNENLSTFEIESRKHASQTLLRCTWNQEVMQKKGK